MPASEINISKMTNMGKLRLAMAIMLACTIQFSGSSTLRSTVKSVSTVTAQSKVQRKGPFDEWAALSSLLSEDEFKKINKTSTMYGCDTNAKNLIENLEKMAAKNRNMSNLLSKECLAAQVRYDAKLTRKLIQAANLEASASARAKAEFQRLQQEAINEFKCREIEHAQEVESAKAEAEKARKRMYEATGHYHAMADAHSKANAIYTLKESSITTLLEDKKSTLQHQVDVAMANMQSRSAAAFNASLQHRNKSELSCKSAFDKQMKMITEDEMVLTDQVKPLLEKLKNCEKKGIAPVPNRGLRFVQMSENNAQRADSLCEDTKKKWKAVSLIQLHMKIDMSDVSGNIGDWERSIEAEKIGAGRVNSACMREAKLFFLANKRDLNKLMNMTKEKILSGFDRMVAELEKGAATQIKLIKAHIESTTEDQYTALAALEGAKKSEQEADAVVKAAEMVKKQRLETAEKIKANAIMAAHAAAVAVENSVKASAKALREQAKAFEENVSKKKSRDCKQDHKYLDNDFSFIQEIIAKIETLYTVRDDSIGKAGDKP